MISKRIALHTDEVVQSIWLDKITALAEVKKKGVLIYLMFIFLVVFLLDERTCSILLTVLINKINYKEH